MHMFDRPFCLSSMATAVKYRKMRVQLATDFRMAAAAAAAAVAATRQDGTTGLLQLTSVDLALSCLSSGDQNRTNAAAS